MAVHQIRGRSATRRTRCSKALHASRFRAAARVDRARVMSPSPTARLARRPQASCAASPWSRASGPSSVLQSIPPAPSSSSSLEPSHGWFRRCAPRSSIRP